MESIRQYLITLVSASMLCSIAISFTGSKGVNSKVTKLIAGLFVTICVISPVIRFEFDDISSYFTSLYCDAEHYSSLGQEQYTVSTAAIIKSKLETYILDKAAGMNAVITVQMTMSQDNPFVPEAVQLSGSVAPYTKQRMEQIIANELGIPKEKQMWI